MTDTAVMREDTPLQRQLRQLRIERRELHERDVRGRLSRRERARMEWLDAEHDRLWAAAEAEEQQRVANLPAAERAKRDRALEAERARNAESQAAARQRMKDDPELAERVRQAKIRAVAAGNAAVEEVLAWQQQQQAQQESPGRHRWFRR